MIRHSSSFFISLILHILLALVIFLSYKTLFVKKPSEESTQKRMKIQLCSVAKPVPKKAIPKKVIMKPKIIKKPKPKVQTKPKIKKVIKKEIPVKVLTPEPIPKIIEPEIIEEVTEEVTEVEAVEEVTPIVQEKQKVIPIEAVESEEEKNDRLEKSYIHEHITQIQKLLQDNLYYPRAARKRRVTGNVLIKFTLSPSGSIHSIKVMDSKSEILSRAAIKTIKDLTNEFPIPEDELTLHIPIQYRLSQ